MVPVAQLDSAPAIPGRPRAANAGGEIAMALAMAVAAAALVGLFAGEPSKKLVAAVAGGALLAIAAFLSGNLRLFCLWGLMLAVPFDLSKRFGPVVGKMGGETAFRLELSDPFVLALLFFILRDVARRERGGLRVPKATLWWLAIMLLGSLSVAFGPFRLSAAQELVRMAKLALLFLVVVNELTRPARIAQCAFALIASVIFQSCVGITEYVTGGQFGLQILGETGSGTIEQLKADTLERAAAFRAGAFLMHPNLFGIFLACLLPIAIALFLLRSGARQSLFSLAAILLGSAAMVATLSRSSWLSFSCAAMLLLTIMVLHHGFRQRSLLAAVAAAVSLVVIGIAFAGPISERLFESKDSAIRSRLEYLATAEKMILEKPVLGWGLNSYAYTALPFTPMGIKKAKEKYKGTTENPGLWLPPVHNIFLLWWAELGAVGLLLHLGLLARIFGAAFRNLKVRHETLFALNLACLCGLSALMVDAFFSFSLRINSILRLFMVLSGMIMAVHYWRLQHEGARFRPQAVAAPGAGGS